MGRARGQGGDRDGDPRLAEDDPAGLSGKVACTVFLGGAICAVPSATTESWWRGETPAALDSGELTAFLKKRQGLLDGVCVTGESLCSGRSWRSF